MFGEQYCVTGAGGWQRWSEDIECHFYQNELPLNMHQIKMVLAQTYSLP